MALNADFYIFRDSRRCVDAAELVADLRSEAARLTCATEADQLISALLRAGELECALEDAHAPGVDSAATARLTDAFAEAVLRCDSSAERQDALELRRMALQILDLLHSAGLVSVSTPEGFTYYALHPLDYADLVERLRPRATRAVVVGIRSIGTTLSAVVAAKLRQLGMRAERMTVRPTGHPYQRQSRFALWQKQAIARAIENDAQFLVCDEGPGRSGSSLLSVAEALQALGVPKDRILMLCSHQPDVNALCAPDAGQRWSRYRCAATGMTRRLPAAAKEYIGGGDWRRSLVAASDGWPAVWPQMERLKYVSSDRQQMLTFEGHGHYGAQVRARNEALSDSGFGTHYFGHQNGFGVHASPNGYLAQRSDLTRELLAHMAAYCAWRAKEFAAPRAKSDELNRMTRTNFEREFDCSLQDFELPIEAPAICDNRMAPHHWLLSSDGRWLKLDATIHGDDHFFPGPCDIAWDLAGIIVEWNLDRSARDQLLSQYSRHTGDPVTQRIRGYEIAYAIFRLAWSKMAMASVQESDEEARLARDRRRYRQLLQKLTPNVFGRTYKVQPVESDGAEEQGTPDLTAFETPAGTNSDTPTLSAAEPAASPHEAA